MNIGQKIKKRRTFLGLTQKDLGMRLGFPESNADIRIAQYESGARIPKLNLLSEFANVLDVPLFYFTANSFDSIKDVFNVIFSLEEECGFTVNRINNRLCLVLEGSDDVLQNEEILSFLSLWHEKLASFKNGIITKEEYDSWRYSLLS